MTTPELIDHFQLSSFGNFSEPIQWLDGVGFSVVENGTNDFASLYKVGFSKQTNSSVKDLWVSVSYGKMTDGGISLGSAGEDLKTPIDLDFHNEFSFNEETQIFYYHRQQIIPRDILLKVQAAHKLPTQNFKGLPLRLKLWYWRKTLPGIVKLFDGLLISILWIISGEKIEKGSIYTRLIGRPEESIQESNIKFKEPKTVEFFGYKAKRWSVVFYCLVHLILYSLVVYFLIRHGFLTRLFKNNFLSLCYVIVSFAIVEHLLPLVLKKAINKSVPQLYGRVAFKRLKINL
jgi:hypothetical protein